jgi:hypothetical protein
MSEVALIPVASPDQFAEPVRNALSGNSGVVVVLAMAALLLLLALGAMVAAARLLLEPVFALIGTLFRLLLILGVAVAIIFMLVSGSAHSAGPGDAGMGQPPAGSLP